MPDHERHRGQVLVLFAGSIVVLLLVGALVFDLGMSWMMRRQEQNAVDPAALAAASYVASLTGPGATAQMYAVSCQYARRNGFFESATTNDGTSTGCIPANDSGRASLTVNYPPVGTSAGEFEGRLGFVQVGITRVHDSIFLGVLGQATSSVSASAVAANTTGNANSYSLVALDPNADQNSGQLGGGGNNTGNVIVAPATNPLTGQPYSGGYVQVNSTYGGVLNPPQATTCPTNGTGAFRVAGNSSIQAPAIFVTGTCGNSGVITTGGGATGNGIVSQGALQVGDPLSELVPPSIDTNLPGQACTSGGTATTAQNPAGCKFNNAGTYQMSPGVYYGGWSIGNNVTLELGTGIYIMAGGGISLNAGGTITSVTGASGPAPVMIYSADDPLYHSQCTQGTGSNSQCQGQIDLTASSTLALAGMDSGPYKGLLVWQDGNSTSGSCVQPTAGCNVTLGGQTNLSIAGTIYAPRVQVTLAGGSSTSGCGSSTSPDCAAIQIISWNWQISGGSTLYMPYDPNQLYHLEQRGLVH